MAADRGEYRTTPQSMDSQVLVLRCYIVALLVTLMLYGQYKYALVGLITLFGLLELVKWRTYSSLIPLLSSILYGFSISLIWLDPNVFRSAISFLLLFAFLQFIYSQWRNIIHVIDILYFFCVFVIFDSLFQYINGADLLGVPLYADFRVSGPFDWNSPVAGTLLVVAYFMLDYSRFTHWRPVHILVKMLAIVVMMLSGSRSVLLQLLFAYGITSIKSGRRLFVFTATMAAVGAILYMYGENIESIDRIRMLLNVESTLEYSLREGEGRLAWWPEIVPSVAKDFIVFGTGLGGLEAVLPNYVHFIHPHFLYFEIILSFGIIGSAPLLWFLYRVYKGTSVAEKRIFWCFWGPFNLLHSVFDLYWGLMMFFSLAVVMSVKKLRYSSVYGDGRVRNEASRGMGNV